MSAGNAKRRAVCCACGSTPVVSCAGPYLWGTSDAARTVTSPYRDPGDNEFSEGGPGGGYLWTGDMKWGIAGDLHYNGTRKQRCQKVLVWEACTLTSDGSRFGFTGSSEADHILRVPGRWPSGSDGHLTPAYAIGGSRASGPYLNTRPDYWPCLQVAGISGASIWCDPPTLGTVVAFLNGTMGTQGAAPWFAPGGTGVTPLPVVGRRYDVALFMTFCKHATSGTLGGSWTYEDDSDGMAFLGGIQFATHDIDLSIYPDYGA